MKDLNSILQKIENKIESTEIEKYKKLIYKISYLISYCLFHKDRKSMKIYPKKLILDKKAKQEIYVFLVDIDNDGNIDSIYDIDGKLIYSDVVLDWIKKPEEFNEELFMQVTLASLIGRKVRIERIYEKDIAKVVYEDLSIPDYFEYFFSERYIDLMDLVTILKAFKREGLDIRGRLKENIDKICKYEKERFGSDEVCNRYKGLYEETIKEKIREFPWIIRYGTKKVDLFGGIFYRYYYTEKDLQKLKRVISESLYNQFLDILKERDIKFAKKYIDLMKNGYVIFEKDIDIGKVLNGKKLKYEYIGNDEVKVRDGKGYIIINPIEKYIIVNKKKIGIGLDPEKIDILKFRIDQIDNKTNITN